MPYKVAWPETNSVVMILGWMGGAVPFIIAIAAPTGVLSYAIAGTLVLCQKGAHVKARAVGPDFCQKLQVP